MTPSISTGTHVAFASPTAEAFSRLGAASVVLASDRLLIGPNRKDPIEHTRAREEFFGSTMGEWDHLYSAEIRWQTPIVVWVSTSIEERVNLWRTLHRLRDLGIPLRDVFPVELERPQGRRLSPFDCDASVADHPESVLWTRVAAAHPWRRARYDRAVSLWEAYVSPDPLPLARTCARGLREFPELGPLWTFLCALLPRITAEGALRPSRFDGLLLGILSTEWQTPVKVFVHDSQMGESLRQLACCTGDVFIADRLAQWAQHGQNPAVERSAGPRPVGVMTAFVYRITARGAELRDRGLECLTDGPALPVAGIEAYSETAPWLLRDDGSLARA